jgi:chaperone modulatory protein CbpM
MIGETELFAMVAPLEADALRRWVERGWVLAQQDGDRLQFDEADIVRVRLICELHYELHIEEDSMSVVLSLIDQLYDARRSLRALASAVEAQPKEVRARIAEHVKGKT